MRSSPRVEGQSKASVQLKPESARAGQNPARNQAVIPDKLALRSVAARKAMKTKTGKIYKKNNANATNFDPCSGTTTTDPDTEVE